MLRGILLVTVLLTVLACVGWANTDGAVATGGDVITVDSGSGSLISSIVEVQKYNRSIHIMAMLLAGFGFLMVFVRKYGRSALTATFLLVAVALPMYMILANQFFGGGHKSDIDLLILSEFAAASLLIAAGAVLGRMKMMQYIVMALLFIPAYALNEWIILDGGFGILGNGGFVDTGGSIVIHAFGALFGLGVAMSMTTPREREIEIETDATSDRFSMLGSIVLWIFWPSFCAALVAPEMVPATVVNVFLALSGSTLATYFLSVWLRGKISIADIANAALAGGVAIGSTCDFATHPAAFLIGILAGALSTFGFAVIQSRLQNGLKLVDTCGVSNLHGLPGLLGGFAALVVVKGISGGTQLLGIGVTVVFAIVTGLVVGKIVSLLGHRSDPYCDAEEFIEDED
ncbi:ammonia channel precursor [bacterium BMS3Bbin04]|nr:ammonia channel precursor [bacterium BMS3Bbin04]